MDRTEGTKMRIELLVTALVLALLALSIVSAAYAAGPGALEPDFANYTERYWDMATEHKAMTTVSDPAEGAVNELDSQPVMSYSGDDTYDLAADGQPAETPAHYAKRFSGDDAYDSAAGGLFYEPTVRYVSNFSGDDAYDPTFGWTPHQVQVAQSSIR